LMSVSRAFHRRGAAELKAFTNSEVEYAVQTVQNLSPECIVTISNTHNV